MRPLVLIILDGWGYAKGKLGNAILSASTPTVDIIAQQYPSMLLQASAKSVGLEWAEPGNSEVGHLTIGAGRVIFQYSARINRAIESGDFYKNEALLAAVHHAKQNNSTVHLIGLLGSGTVHSSISHLFSLMELAQQNGITKLNLHLFADGKDSGLKESPELIKKVQAFAQKVGIGTIATVIGRKYAMDRDNNWDRTQTAYDLFTSGKGEVTTDVFQTIATSYGQELTDTTLHPIVVDPAGIIQDNDGVIFFNFREDSMRQIARAFTNPEFNNFPRKQFSNLFVTFMTQYMEAPGLPIAFPLPEVKNGLAEVVSTQGFKQLHIAETEKYAHATYFFNCLHNGIFPGETDVLVESHKNHAEHPEMKAGEIMEKFLENFAALQPEFTIINFANADIIAHMGKLELATQGVEFIDAALSKIKEAVLAQNGILVITADHGNAESMLYKNGEAETKHNTNPVPLYLVAKEYERTRSAEEIAASMDDPKGLLSDVAPTILELMKKEVPSDMTGTSLLRLLA